MNFKPFGILPAMMTPFKEGGGINEKALRKLIDYLIDGGVHGIFALGTSGEFYALNEDEYRYALEVTKDQINGRVHLYAGANSITTKGTIHLAQIANEVGVDALSVLTPFFVSPSQEELYTHYKAIADSVETPIIIYNNLPKTGVTVTTETVQRLAQIDNIVGIKDSTGDLTLAGEYIRLTRDLNFEVMMGRDTLIYGGLCYGAGGAVATCGNVVPSLIVEIYDRFKAGDHKGALEAQYRLAPLRIACGLGTFPVVIKEALKLIGIDLGPCVAPVGSLSDEKRQKLKEVLEQIGVLK